MFFGKRRSAIKVLFFDGNFRLPERLDAQGTSIAIDERTLDDLLDGIDVEPAPPRRTRRPRVH